MERKKHGGYGSEGRGRSYTRESNFCTTTFSRFCEGGLREETGEFTCALTYICAAREKE